MDEKLEEYPTFSYTTDDMFEIFILAALASQVRQGGFQELKIHPPFGLLEISTRENEGMHHWFQPGIPQFLRFGEFLAPLKCNFFDE